MAASLLAVVVCLAGLAAPARAGDPGQVWHTIETAHFEVHYYDPLGDVAHKVAASAERAYSILTLALRHRPSGKTHIVVVDDTDGSNGFATVLPRNHILLYASSPPDLSDLDEQDDWLFNLVSHEFTHIVHLDTIGGLPAVVNHIMGKVWAPNQVQPTWVIEGLAVYEESKRSSAGRNRQSQFDMQLRVATLEGGDLRLDQMSNGPRAWPHGNAAYLYGSHFLKYVFDRYGDDKAAVMSHVYGSSAIPYGVNRSIERATGRTFEQLYDEWRRYREDRYGLQAEAVDRAGRREGRRLTFTGENNINPHYTTDGKSIIWQRGDGYSIGQFRIMPADQNAGRSSTYAVIERSGAFDVLKDGSMAVEQTQTYQDTYNFQELVLWNKRTGDITHLTHAQRVSDPAVSPDNHWVAFVKNGHGRRRLAIMPIEAGATPRILWTGPDPYDQAFSPSWSPDGRHIAFSAWFEGGRRDILIADVPSGRVRAVTGDRAQDTEPVYSPDGRYLYFNSDRTGIYNIYAYDLHSGQLWQVTDVLGCAITPDVSPDGRHMVYQGFAAGGTELYEIELDPSRWTPAEPYINDRPDPAYVPPDSVAVSAPRPYRAIETLAPLSYQVGLQLNSLGQALTLQTNGGDVVGHHSYSLAATIDLDVGDVSIGGAYSYHRLWPSLSLAAARTVNRRGGWIIDDQSQTFTEERVSGTASAGLPILRSADASSNLSFDYDIDRLNSLDQPAYQPDPNQTLPRKPETDITLAGLAMRWNYSSSRGYLYTVGQQQGIDLGASVRFDHPLLGAQETSLTVGWSGAWYHQLPLVGRPSLMVRLAGGYRATDRARVDQFSLGGVPQSQDLVQSFINNLRVGNTGYLRGYPARIVAGQEYHLANLELRQKLMEVERGVSTLPFYLRRLHAALLFDAGDATDGSWPRAVDPGGLKVGVGAALRLDFTVGYAVPGSLELGYARGLSQGGIDQTWLLLTSTL